MAENETAYLASLILALAALLTVATLHGLFWFTIAVDHGFVLHTCRDNWSRYDLDIVLTDWLLYIWVSVYVLQALWLLYALVSFARRNPKTNKSFLVDPPLIPSIVYVLFIFGLGAIIGWLILKDLTQYERFSILSIAIGIVCFCVTSALTLRAASRYQVDLRDLGLHGQLWTLRILVHNSLTTLATWTASVTMFTAAFLLADHQLVSKDVAQYMAIGLTMAYLAIWCAIDIFLSHHVTDYVLGPYLVAMVTFAMPVVKNSHQPSLLFSMGTIFLAISALLLVLKVSVAVGRRWQHPRYTKFAARRFSGMSSNADSELIDITQSAELSTSAPPRESILPRF